MRSRGTKQNLPVLLLRLLWAQVHEGAKVWFSQRMLTPSRAPHSSSLKVRSSGSAPPLDQGSTRKPPRVAALMSAGQSSLRLDRKEPSWNGGRLTGIIRLSSFSLDQNPDRKRRGWLWPAEEGGGQAPPPGNQPSISGPTLLSSSSHQVKRPQMFHQPSLWVCCDVINSPRPSFTNNNKMAPRESVCCTVSIFPAADRMLIAVVGQTSAPPAPFHAETRTTPQMERAEIPPRILPSTNHRRGK